MLRSATSSSSPGNKRHSARQPNAADLSLSYLMDRISAVAVAAVLRNTVAHEAGLGCILTSETEPPAVHLLMSTTSLIEADFFGKGEATEGQGVINDGRLSGNKEGSRCWRNAPQSLCPPAPNGGPVAATACTGSAQLSSSA